MRWKFCLAICLILILPGCSSVETEAIPELEAIENDASLTIWWEKGFNVQEDEAFINLVKNWEKISNHSVKLSFYTTSELLEKAQRAAEMGKPPDLMMSYPADLTLYPRLAWSGQLADVREIVEKQKQEYSPQVLQAISYYNHAANKTSYYGVPVYQSTVHIFYWRRLLQEIGLTQADIPQQWREFWLFWQQAQSELNRQKGINIYAFGFPMSVGSTDTYLFFEHILAAHEVNIINPRGELIINQPATRQKILECLRWYSQLYQQGFVPQDAIKWLNTDNNLNFLNRVVLMTPNATLSIPAGIREDNATYYQRMGMVNFPFTPAGQPMPYRTSIKQIVMFRAAENPQVAKKFLQYFIQPEVIASYLRQTGSRMLPVHKSVWQNPFWAKTTDPYLSQAREIFNSEQIHLHYTVYHPAYSQVLKQNVWGKALQAIILEGKSPTVATDNAIAEINRIFQNWE